MTFFHFLNCVALTYAPYFIAYKYSGLAEYSSVWKCAQAGAAYFLTQLVKLLTLATFFPASEHEGLRFDFFPELMKSSMELADLAGLYIVMRQSLAGKGEVRFLAAGLGWAAADSVATRLVPLWVGARGLAFDWKFIQMGLQSNLTLVHFVSVAGLVWLWGRTDLQQHIKQTVASLLIFAWYRQFIFELLGQWLTHSWALLVVEACLTVAVALSTLLLHANIKSRHENHIR